MFSHYTVFVVIICLLSWSGSAQECTLNMSTQHLWTSLDNGFPCPGIKAVGTLYGTSIGADIPDVHGISHPSGGFSDLFIFIVWDNGVYKMAGVRFSSMISSSTPESYMMKFVASDSGIIPGLNSNDPETRRASIISLWDGTLPGFNTVVQSTHGAYKIKDQEITMHSYKVVKAQMGSNTGKMSGIIYNGVSGVSHPDGGYSDLFIFIVWNGDYYKMAGVRLSDMTVSQSPETFSSRWITSPIRTIPDIDSIMPEYVRPRDQCLERSTLILMWDGNLPGKTTNVNDPETPTYYHIYNPEFLVDLNVPQEYMCSLQCDVGFVPQGDQATCTGTVFSSGDVQCVPCPQGFTTRDQGSLVCECPKGWTLDFTSYQCKACPIGFYKDTVGNTTCTECQKGMITGSSNSTSPEQCFCDPDEHLSPYMVEGLPNITLCGCNKGWTGVEGSTCVKCPKGSYKTGIGFHNCQDCPSGKTSPMGSWSMENCTIPNEFCPNTTPVSSVFSGSKVQSHTLATLYRSGLSFLKNKTLQTEHFDLMLESCLLKRTSDGRYCWNIGSGQSPVDDCFDLDECT